MKTKLIAFTSFFLVASLLYSTPIEVDIKGKMARLEIIGNSSKTVKVSSEDHLKSEYKIKEKDGKWSINLLNQEGHYTIYVPDQSIVDLRPEDIFYEGGKYTFENGIPIYCKNLNGKLEFNGDIYHIFLESLTAKTSIVTYGNIKGSIGDIGEGDYIFLDTYLGDIDIAVPKGKKLQIKATAKKGTVQISEQLKNSGDNILLKLHTENGNISVFEVGEDQENPELEKALIQLYLEDQGKQVVDDAILDRLSQEGYRDFIEALPEVPNWHRDYKDKHYTLVTELIKKHGPLLKDKIHHDIAKKGLLVSFLNSPKLRAEHPKMALSLLGKSTLNKLNPLNKNN